MKKILLTILLSLTMQAAWAIELGEAKAQGLVGETNSGYVAAVKDSSADVRALVKKVNAKRKAQFENTANKTGTTVKQVSARFYELAVQRTASGHYYQDAGGNWRRK